MNFAADDSTVVKLSSETLEDENPVRTDYNIQECAPLANIAKRVKIWIEKHDYRVQVREEAMIKPISFFSVLAAIKNLQII
jgi:hypothetical protein